MTLIKGIYAASMSVLKDDLMQSNHIADASLVDKLRDVLCQRYFCYGNLSVPVNCSNDLGWQMLRTCLQHPSYWLSIQEIQFVAAVYSCSLTIMCSIDGKDDFKVSFKIKLKSGEGQRFQSWFEGEQINMGAYYIKILKE